MRDFVTILATVFAGLIACPAYAQLTPRPDEVQVGPVNVAQDVQGVSVNMPTRSFISISTSPQGVKVRTRTFAYLGDLQAKIGSIVDTVPLPRDNCRSYSANNPVVRIPTKDR